MRLIAECLCGWEQQFERASAKALAPVVIARHLEGRDAVDHAVNFFEASAPPLCGPTSDGRA
jgi:hypothetical protein